VRDHVDENPQAPEGAVFKYDVALSYASEDAAYVSAVAGHLRRARLRVFFDQYERTDLWGKDLFEHLDMVYRVLARYCVMFISSHYAAKVWTNHERRSAQARALNTAHEYILPARFDDTPVPGLPSTVKWIDLRQLSSAEFAVLVRAKVRPLRSERQRRTAPGPRRSSSDARAKLTEWNYLHELVREAAVTVGSVSGGDEIRRIDYEQMTVNAERTLQVASDRTEVWPAPDIVFLCVYAGSRPEQLQRQQFSQFAQLVFEEYGEDFGLLVTDRQPEPALVRSMTETLSENTWIWRPPDSDRWCVLVLVDRRGDVDRARALITGATKAMASLHQEWGLEVTREIELERARLVSLGDRPDSE
jgi:hypothetical protein